MLPEASNSSGSSATPKPSDNALKRRVLVPLDGSSLAAKAVPIAEYLCRQLAAELDLVIVLPTLVLPPVVGQEYVPAEVYQQIEEQQRQDARAHLDRVAADVRQQGVGTAVHEHLARGNTAAEVLDLAAQLRPTLIVMTTHGRTGLARFALGSVADRVVRGGEAPVLLLRSFPSPRHGPSLAHALVPLDGSPLAESPLFSIVLQLAGPVLRSITLLRVADPRDGIEGRLAAETYLAAVQQRVLERLEGRDCHVTSRLRVGRNPAQCIMDCAEEEEECDLVLMSTHGEAGIGRLAFGGVTDRVLRDGQTPLLLVHPPKQ